MKQQIYIEQLKKYSLDAVTALNSLLMQLNNRATPLTKSAIREMMDSPATRLFVARRLDNNQIIGILAMIVYRIPYTKKGLLEDFVVDEKYRRCGIGTKLVKFAIDKAQKEVDERRREFLKAKPQASYINALVLRNEIPMFIE